MKASWNTEVHTEIPWHFVSTASTLDNLSADQL